MRPSVDGEVVEKLYKRNKKKEKKMGIQLRVLETLTNTSTSSTSTFLQIYFFIFAPRDRSIDVMILLLYTQMMTKYYHTSTVLNRDSKTMVRVPLVILRLPLVACRTVIAQVALLLNKNHEQFFLVLSFSSLRILLIFSPWLDVFKSCSA